MRGITWLMEERCEGSYTKVKQGKMSVRDLRRHRTVLVGAGHGCWHGPAANGRARIGKEARWLCR